MQVQTTFVGGINPWLASQVAKKIQRTTVSVELTEAAKKSAWADVLRNQDYRKQGLNAAQIKVLFYISECGPVAFTHVRVGLNTSVSTVSRAIVKLMEMGLITTEIQMTLGREITYYKALK